MVNFSFTCIMASRSPTPSLSAEGAYDPGIVLNSDVEICVYDAWSFWLGARWVVPASGSMGVFQSLVCWDEWVFTGCVGLICDVEICVYDAWSFWLGARWVVPASGSMEVSF